MTKINTKTLEKTQPSEMKSNLFLVARQVLKDSHYNKVFTLYVSYVNVKVKPDISKRNKHLEQSQK